MPRNLRRTAGRRCTTAERKAHAGAVQLYPRRSVEANKRLRPVLTHYPAELSTAPELIRKLVPAHAESELKGESSDLRPKLHRLTDRAGNGIDVDNFVPIPIEQLRISLDVGKSLLSGKHFF